MIEGHCDRAFEDVRQAFADNFERGELGAACAVSIGGRVVVDLWGGWADPGHTRPWERDTLVNAYSVGKPVVATSLLQLVARGDVDLDARADTYWPELVAGRRGATVRHVLCHRAGVPAIRRPLSNDALWDWDAMCAAVAETEPWWEPGTQHAYHTNTYGYLCGEIARRLTGDLPGTWLRERIAGPLGADLHWGLDDDAISRCADVIWEGPSANVEPPSIEGLDDDARMIVQGYFNPPGASSLGVVNTPEWRRTQVPSTNLHATARGVARFYEAVLGGTVLEEGVLREATTVQSEGWCPYLEREVSFGLGFQPTRPDRPFGPNPGSYGHFGTGGAVGFADPVAGIAFGYVMNRVFPRWQNERNRALIDALYACA